jgi:hypothetical protein
VRERFRVRCFHCGKKVRCSGRDTLQGPDASRRLSILGASVKPKITGVPENVEHRRQRPRKLLHECLESVGKTVSSDAQSVAEQLLCNASRFRDSLNSWGASGWLITGAAPATSCGVHFSPARKRETSSSLAPSSKYLERREPKLTPAGFCLHSSEIADEGPGRREPGNRASHRPYLQ